MIFEPYVAWAEGKLPIPAFGPAGGTNFMSFRSLSQALEGALLRGERLRYTAGILFAHTPARGAPQALHDLVGGQVDFMFDNITSMAGAIRAGQVRPLAVTSRKRSAALPDVPTMEEAGLPGFEVVAWGGILAPAGTPRPVIDRLNREINTWLQLPTTQADFAPLGQVALGGTPEFFRTHIQAEAKKWGDVIRRAGVRLD